MGLLDFLSPLPKKPAKLLPTPDQLDAPTATEHPISAKDPAEDGERSTTGALTWPDLQSEVHTINAVSDLVVTDVNNLPEPTTASADESEGNTAPIALPNSIVTLLDSIIDAAVTEEVKEKAIALLHEFGADLDYVRSAIDITMPSVFGNRASDVHAVLLDAILEKIPELHQHIGGMISKGAHRARVDEYRWRSKADSLQKQVDEQDATIKALREQYFNSKTVIAGYMGKIADMQAKIHTLEQTLTKNDAEIDKLENENLKIKNDKFDKVNALYHEKLKLASDNEALHACVTKIKDIGEQYDLYDTPRAIPISQPAAPITPLTTLKAHPRFGTPIERGNPASDVAETPSVAPSKKRKYFETVKTGGHGKKLHIELTDDDDDDDDDAGDE